MLTEEQKQILGKFRIGDAVKVKRAGQREFNEGDWRIDGIQIDARGRSKIVVKKETRNESGYRVETRMVMREVLERWQTE